MTSQTQVASVPVQDSGSSRTLDTRETVTPLLRDDHHEEPLFSSAEEGYGYYASPLVGYRLGQYRLVRKLGWARHSTVWLGIDMATDPTTYVAVKILTAHATACIVGGLSPEYEVFRRIESANPRHPGFQHCLTLRRCFTATSAAGNHICFVTNVLGSSLKMLRPLQRSSFTIPVAKRIIKQILLALDYLHRECGYIHTDLKADNVLVLPSDLIGPQIYEYLQANPPVASMPSLNHKISSRPVFIAKSQPLPDFGLNRSLDNIRVCVIDYGQATKVEKYTHGDHYQPAIVRAPEVILGHPWSSPIDIWAVGCLLFELITDFHLFGQPNMYSTDFHLQNMAEYLGPFPPRFLEACSRQTDYFSDSGALLRVTNFTPSSLESILNDMQTVEKNDVPDVAAFMRRCLTLDPISRSSAQDLLNDVWLEGI